ncbi:MAG TPA: glutathione S-transferase family protein [Burkholderiaceae bacterium]|jgi:glutathione S-transferase|nr:glutathione S-transferase family protein [Burkholderiaceae bacterium]
MLTIWGRATSSNVQKVLWVCDEIGVRFERIDAGGSFGRTSEPAYRRMNPNGLVPTLEDDGFILWESNTICRYLANKHQATSLYPGCVALEDVRQRAEIEKWMDWANSHVGPALGPAFHGLVRTPADERDPQAILGSAEKTCAAMQILDQQLATRPYVAGDHLTLADIPLGIHAYRWLHLPWKDVGYERPQMRYLETWYERLTQRAPYRMWVTVPIS